MRRRKGAFETNGMEDVMILDRSETRCRITVASKFHSNGIACAQDGRAKKMDLSKMRQCSAILKKLMTHQAGWLFNQPVDPIKLRIPDYFTVISKPMDLGTIKSKLDRKLYWSTDQFAADVRLTFANAMQYNPPENEVHIIAEELNNIFNSNWRFLEENWRKEHNFCHEETEVMERTEKIITSRKIIGRMSGPKKPPSHRRSLTDAEKLKLRKDCAKTANVREHCSNIYQGFCEGATRSPRKRNPTCQDKENSSMCRDTDNLDLPDFDHLPFEEPQSPTKALRAAMLKSRFADTILKAQHKSLLSNGEKVDLVKLKQEREKLEKKQEEEKARLEAQVKEVQDAAAKAEAQMKMQREKEREAARLALQNMEKTVDIDENGHILKELELLACATAGSQYAEPDEMLVNLVNGGHLQFNTLKPLEKLGLFMKNDLDDDFDQRETYVTLYEDMEEGEIGLS